MLTAIPITMNNVLSRGMKHTLELNVTAKHIHLYVLLYEVAEGEGGALKSYKYFIYAYRVELEICLLIGLI